MADLRIDDRARSAYADVLGPDVVATLNALTSFDVMRQDTMRRRLERRAARAGVGERIAFPDPAGGVPGPLPPAQTAGDGRFMGSAIPDARRRQWIRGPGPAARPDTAIEQSIRNVAYALLSGADGW